ncbi:MAG: hypothetical protein ACYTG0_25035 [Planctomycetota bacterium]|jgi:hypothetical protein
MTIELLVMFCLVLWSVFGACALTAWAVRNHYRNYVEHLERVLWCYRITGKEPTRPANDPKRPSGCNPMTTEVGDPEKSAKIDLSPQARLQRKQLREYEQDPKRTMIRNARNRAGGRQTQ